MPTNQEKESMRGASGFAEVLRLSTKLMLHAVKPFTTPWANSADNTVMIFFLSFPRKQDLTCHANCLHRNNLHEIPNLFTGKNKKNISICHLLKILPRVLNFDML